jgi:hypothetical protein
VSASRELKCVLNTSIASFARTPVLRALMWELAILASQRACMRVVVRRLAALLLEFPAHPASVPDADSIPVQSQPNKQKRHRKGVVNAGIGHPGQPPRLHARCRSQARSSAARIPCSPRVRTGRGPNFRSIAIKTKSPPARGELFVLLVETAGIEPASASPLQAVLHT